MTLDEIKALGRSLHGEHPEAKRSHVLEAIAAGFGYRTYAGLRYALNHNEPQFAWDRAAFDARLASLTQRAQEQVTP